MSTYPPASPDEDRFFLSLPRGSVRAILALQIVGLFWLLLLLPPEHRIPIPLNLYFLLSLVLIFFVSHGRTIAGANSDGPSPLFLPAGSIRVLIVLGTAGVLAYLHFSRGENLAERLTPDPAQLRHWPGFLGAMLGGFAVGYLLRCLPLVRSRALKVINSWVSVVAMLLLVVEAIIQLTILPTLKQEYDLYIWESVLTAVVAFYFGSRS
ncbi:MAG TPA: hypothetical protein VIL46_02205 [Gemmataceae bacterium]